ARSTRSSRTSRPAGRRPERTTAMTDGPEQQVTDVDPVEGTGADVDANAASAAPAPPGWMRAARLLGAVAVLVGLPLLVQWAFDFTKQRDANRFAIVGVAIALGVIGVFALFWLMDQIVNRLPKGWRETVRPYVFVGPALVVLSVFLIYPVINTILLS